MLFYFQRKLTDKIHEGLTIASQFTLTTLSTSFFLQEMLSTDIKTVAVICLVLFRTLSHLSTSLRASDYFYHNFTGLTASLHSREEDPRYKLRTMT